LLFAAVAAFATLVSPIALESRLPLGQDIVVAMGAALTASAFAFGAMLAFQNRHARKMGILVVALAFSSSALCGLLAFFVEQFRLEFLIGAAITLLYAVAATHTLIRWPEAGSRERTKSTLGIFISYRRDDAIDTVGRIYDYLKQDFDEERLFLDVERQEAGENYKVAIRSALERSDVLLAVIGLKWVGIADEQGRRRLDDSADLVRWEIEFALDSRVRVIPILVQNAKMPKSQDLPESLRTLCDRNAIAIRPDPDFRRDIDRLVSALRASGFAATAVDRP
jgi:hypothetical protein